ncbi:hypothetical protein SO802_006487 [Lithocarpus litseifolius]|uniref:Uncharacterized protein n=1 Tax=Lithocarpus litseifolius TaxID=425828 RepID=A0AAW2DPG1_9ROSI
MLSLDLSMANKNQPILHIDIASDVEFRPSTKTLDPKITQLIMHLKSLQKDIKDYSKRFNELLKPFVQEEDAVKETLNEFPKSLKDIGDNSEGTEKGNEELKNDGDVGKRFLAKVMEACREMVESDSLHDQGGELTANAEDISTNIEGLEEDLREMNTGKKNLKQRLKGSLKLVSTEDENSMVINKIGTLLEQAKRNEPMKGKWAGLEQTGLDESNQEESSNKRSRTDDL